MDIVERLRMEIGGYTDDYLEKAEADMKEAADEIERLRQQNAGLVDALKEAIDPHSIAGSQVWLDKVYDILDKATGGE